MSNNALDTVTVEFGEGTDGDAQALLFESLTGWIVQVETGNGDLDARVVSVSNADGGGFYLFPVDDDGHDLPQHSPVFVPVRDLVRIHIY